MPYKLPKAPKKLPINNVPTATDYYKIAKPRTTTHPQIANYTIPKQPLLYAVLYKLPIM